MVGQDAHLAGLGWDVDLYDILRFVYSLEREIISAAPSHMRSTRERFIAAGLHRSMETYLMRHDQTQLDLQELATFI